MLKNKHIVITNSPLKQAKDKLCYYIFFSQKRYIIFPKRPARSTLIFEKSRQIYFLKRITMYLFYPLNQELKPFCRIVFLMLSIWVCGSSHALTITSPIQEAALIQGQATADETVFIGETQIPVHTDGRFYFGIPQDAKSPLHLKVITKGKQSILSYPIQKRHWDEERIHSLPSSKVQISKANQKRIQSENALLAKQRTVITKDSFPVCLTHPLKTPYRISGSFGNRRIFNNVIPAGHSGTDYAAPQKTPVYAIADGTVVLTHEDMFLSGKTILINHGYGLFSSYSHLSVIHVSTGQKIKQGDPVGQIGSTGRATGPHLHFTLTWFTTRLDPEQAFQTFLCP